MGNDADGLSLKNFQASLNQIKAMNEYRKQIGLEAFKVNYDLMLGAGFNANYSATVIGHAPTAFTMGGYAEDAAWNHFPTADFTHQWVDEEKIIFDKACVKAGFTAPAAGSAADFYTKNKSAIDKALDELLAAGGIKHKVIGHYIAIVTPNYKTIGFGLTTENRGAGYPVTAVADFGYYNGSNGIDVNTAVQQLNDYINSLHSDANINQLKTKLENVKAEQKQAADQLAAKQTAATSAQNALQSAQHAVMSARQLVETTSKTATQKQEALSAAQAALNSAKQQLSDAQTLQDKADATQTQAQKAADSTVAIKAEKQQAYDTAQADANSKKADWQTKRDDFNNKYGEVAPLTEKRDAAKQAYDDASVSYFEAKAKYDIAMAKFNATQKALADWRAKHNAVHTEEQKTTHVQQVEQQATQKADKNSESDLPQTGDSSSSAALAAASIAGIAIIAAGEAVRRRIE